MTARDVRELARVKALLEIAVAALNDTPEKQREVLDRFGWHVWRCCQCGLSDAHEHSPHCDRLQTRS